VNEPQLVAVATGNRVSEVSHHGDRLGDVKISQFYETYWIRESDVVDDQESSTSRHQQIMGEHDQVVTVRATQLKKREI